MKIILLGAPGAGKGTQAETISAKKGIPIISTGNILREAIKKKTKTGLEAKGFMDSGKLVPDEVVVALVKERLEQADCKNGCIFDGFPRTIAQAEVIDQMGLGIDLVVEIYVPDDEIIRRMSGRRACPGCGATYHLEFKPSGKGEQCDKCGDTLTIRDDDLPQTVKDRLEVYHAKTEPLIEYYKKSGKLRRVVGQTEVADTTKLTLDAVGISE